MVYKMTTTLYIFALYVDQEFELEIKLELSQFTYHLIPIPKK